LLIPPILCDARVFGPQINTLSATMPVMYAPTTQGERIEEIASQILGWAPARFALAGLSMGGAVALEMLRRAPARVSRLALISASALPDTPEAAAAREPLIIAARSGRFADVIPAEMNPAWLAAGATRMSVSALVADMARAQGPEAYVRQARAMQRRKDQQSALRQISQPVFVICGAEDSLLPLRRHAFMAEMIPGATLRVIERAGHLPTLENPADLTAALVEWLSQT
jgi:pimeloyl-ACP methyl ester carboxylesterase